MSLNAATDSTTANPAPPRKPHASTVTTVPSNTFIDAKVTPGEGELIYWPEQNAFLALYEHPEMVDLWQEHKKAQKALATSTNTLPPLVKPWSYRY